MEVRGQLRPPAALPMRKGLSRHLLYIAKFGGSQSSSEPFRKEKTLLWHMSIGLRTILCPLSSPVTILTELTQLLSAYLFSLLLLLHTAYQFCLRAANFKMSAEECKELERLVKGKLGRSGTKWWRSIRDTVSEFTWTNSGTPQNTSGRTSCIPTEIQNRIPPPKYKGALWLSQLTQDK